MLAGIGIRSHGGPPTQPLEVPIEGLSGGKDCHPRIPEWVEGNKIRGTDSGHGKVCEEGKRGNGYW
jgi:hypothetical protein